VVMTGSVRTVSEHSLAERETFSTSWPVSLHTNGCFSPKHPIGVHGGLNLRLQT